MTRCEQNIITNKLHQKQNGLANRLAQKLKHELAKTHGKPITKIDQPHTLTNTRCGSKIDDERIIIAGKVERHHFSTQIILPEP